MPEGVECKARAETDPGVALQYGVGSPTKRNAAVGALRRRLGRCALVHVLLVGTDR